ncbi:MAG: ribose-phosphate diphosphokinase, partial [Flavobacteriales bacterium]
STVFFPYLQQKNIPDLLMAAPDTGGTKRANAYAKMLGCDLAICYKQRKVANQVESITVIGDVKGKNVVIVDDMCDTAGTLCKAAEVMLENGASSVRALCTHAVLSGQAYERIESSVLQEVIVTDSIPLQTARPSAKITVLETAELFAGVLRNLLENKSISSNFIIS